MRREPRVVNGAPSNTGANLTGAGAPANLGLLWSLGGLREDQSPSEATRGWWWKLIPEVGAVAAILRFVSPGDPALGMILLGAMFAAHIFLLFRILRNAGPHGPPLWKTLLPLLAAPAAVYGLYMALGHSTHWNTLPYVAAAVILQYIVDGVISSLLRGPRGERIIKISDVLLALLRFRFYEAGQLGFLSLLCWVDEDSDAAFDSTFDDGPIFFNALIPIVMNRIRGARTSEDRPGAVKLGIELTNVLDGQPELLSKYLTQIRELRQELITPSSDPTLDQANRNLQLGIIEEILDYVNQRPDSAPTVTGTERESVAPAVPEQAAPPAAAPGAEVNAANSPGLETMALIDGFVNRSSKDDREIAPLGTVPNAASQSSARTRQPALSQMNAPIAGKGVTPSPTGSAGLTWSEQVAVDTVGTILTFGLLNEELSNQAGIKRRRGVDATVKQGLNKNPLVVAVELSSRERQRQGLSEQDYLTKKINRLMAGESGRSPIDILAERHAEFLGREAALGGDITERLRTGALVLLKADEPLKAVHDRAPTREGDNIFGFPAFSPENIEAIFLPSALYELVTANTPASWHYKLIEVKGTLRGAQIGLTSELRRSDAVNLGYSIPDWPTAVRTYISQRDGPGPTTWMIHGVRLPTSNESAAEFEDRPIVEAPQQWGHPEMLPGSARAQTSPSAPSTNTPGLARALWLTIAAIAATALLAAIIYLLSRLGWSADSRAAVAVGSSLASMLPLGIPLQLLRGGSNPIGRAAAAELVPAELPFDLRGRAQAIIALARRAVPEDRKGVVGAFLQRYPGRGALFLYPSEIDPEIVGAPAAVTHRAYQKLYFPPTNIFLVSRVNSGNQAVVRLAFDETGTPVAVKTYVDESAEGDARLKADYENGRQAMEDLSGAAIYGMVMSPEPENRPSLSMELVPGDRAEAMGAYITVDSISRLLRIRRLLSLKGRAITKEFQVLVTRKGDLRIIDAGRGILPPEAVSAGDAEFYEKLAELLSGAPQDVRWQAIRLIRVTYSTVLVPFHHWLTTDARSRGLFPELADSIQANLHGAIFDAMSTKSGARELPAQIRGRLNLPVELEPFFGNGNLANIEIVGRSMEEALNSLFMGHDDQKSIVLTPNGLRPGVRLIGSDGQDIALEEPVPPTPVTLVLPKSPLAAAVNRSIGAPIRLAREAAYETGMSGLSGVPPIPPAQLPAEHLPTRLSAFAPEDLQAILGNFPASDKWQNRLVDIASKDLASYAYAMDPQLSAADIEDVVQQTWVNAFQAAIPYEGEGNAQGYLLRILQNVMRERGRRLSGRRDLPLESVGIRPGSDHPRDSLASTAASPERTLITSEEERIAKQHRDQALQNAPVEWRLAISAREDRHLSYEAIVHLLTTRLGRPVQLHDVKNWIKRGRDLIVERSESQADDWTAKPAYDPRDPLDWSLAEVESQGPLRMRRLQRNRRLSDSGQRSSSDFDVIGRAVGTKDDRMDLVQRLEHDEWNEKIKAAVEHVAGRLRAAGFEIPPDRNGECDFRTFLRDLEERDRTTFTDDRPFQFEDIGLWIEKDGLQVMIANEFAESEADPDGLDHLGRDRWSIYAGSMKEARHEAAELREMAKAAFQNRLISADDVLTGTLGQIYERYINGQLSRIDAYGIKRTNAEIKANRKKLITMINRFHDAGRQAALMESGFPRPLDWLGRKAYVGHTRSPAGAENDGSMIDWIGRFVGGSAGRAGLKRAPSAALRKIALALGGLAAAGIAVTLAAAQLGLAAAAAGIAAVLAAGGLFWLGAKYVPAWYRAHQLRRRLIQLDLKTVREAGAAMDSAVQTPLPAPAVAIPAAFLPSFLATRRTLTLPERLKNTAVRIAA
ncbi:MAG TPA: sigma factor [Elusimicrobiota bacterium]|nr:sigma factor [Elusimicrobiota bacterium]